jgi:chromosome segregation ATPase
MDILGKIKTMKEKRMREQADCKAFEGQLENANRRLATMEAFLEECQGDARLAEEAETKMEEKYEESKEELIDLRAQMVSFRKGSEVIVQGRR